MFTVLSSANRTLFNLPRITRDVQLSYIPEDPDAVVSDLRRYVDHIFEEHDIDKDGKLTREEFTEAMRNHTDLTNIPAQALQEVIEQVIDTGLQHADLPNVTTLDGC